MTARRREYLFAFGHVMGYGPRDVDDLTLSEFEQLTAEIDAYLNAMKEGA